MTTKTKSVYTESTLSDTRARGRNGFFSAKTACVILSRCGENGEPCVSFDLSSKKAGKAPPVFVSFASKDDLQKIHDMIGKALDAWKSGNKEVIMKKN